MIKVDQLSRKYGDFTAVQDLSFAVSKGQIVGLLGHNGAGKTTTLKILTGYLEATSGSVSIAGLDINDDRLAIQAKIGYLPENSPLYTEMSVVAYLEYVAKMRSIPENEIPAAIREVVTATQIGDKINENISTLSKGYRQRLGVAQAIIHKPDILILDEPTNGLDPTQITAMRNLIKKLSATTTVILSTHIMQEVEAICDRVLIILDGRLVLDSNLKDLQQNQLSLLLKEPQDVVKPLLEKIDGIEAVNSSQTDQGLQEYLLTADDPKIAAVVAKTVVDQGWNLYSLYRKQRNLETVFRETNQSVRR